MRKGPYLGDQLIDDPCKFGWGNIWVSGPKALIGDSLPHNTDITILKLDLTDTSKGLEQKSKKTSSREDDDMSHKPGQGPNRTKGDRPSWALCFITRGSM